MKMRSMFLVVLWTSLTFFGPGNDGLFYCEVCCLVSWLYLLIQVLSPGMILDMKVGSSRVCWWRFQHRAPESGLESRVKCRRYSTGFKNMTYRTRASSGNSDGIPVLLHKGTILKGMVPQLESSEYLLEYRPSIGTFWYHLILGHCSQVLEFLKHWPCMKINNSCQDKEDWGR